MDRNDKENVCHPFICSVLFVMQSQVLYPEGGAFENMIGKGENVAYQHFLLFQPYFLHHQRNFRFLDTFGLSSVNAFKLDKSGKLSLKVLVKS